MIIDEAFLKELTTEKIESGEYASGIILPDGTYILTDNHLQSLMELTAKPREEIWDMIPKEDSPLFFMLQYTGCVITDREACVGLVMNAAQQRTYQTLVACGVLTDKYYDITNERLKNERKHSF